LVNCYAQGIVTPDTVLTAIPVINQGTLAAVINPGIVPALFELLIGDANCSQPGYGEDGGIAAKAGNIPKASVAANAVTADFIIFIPCGELAGLNCSYAPKNIPKAADFAACPVVDGGIGLPKPIKNASAQAFAKATAFPG